MTVKTKKERVLSRLIYSELKDMSKHELRYLRDGLKDLMITVENTPIKREVINRRYGIDNNKIEWLVANKVRYMKRIDKELDCKGQGETGVFTIEILMKELNEYKFEIIGMLRDGAAPSDIYDEFDLFPSVRALQRFKREVIEEGYAVRKSK